MTYRGGQISKELTGKNKKKVDRAIKGLPLVSKKTKRWKREMESGGR